VRCVFGTIWREKIKHKYTRRFHLCPKTDLNAARQARSNAVPNFFITQIFAEMLLLGSGDPAGSQNQWQYHRLQHMLVGSLAIQKCPSMPCVVSVLKVLKHVVSLLYEASGTHPSCCYDEFPPFVRAGGTQEC
jgi:hypothetical protein